MATDYGDIPYDVGEFEPVMYLPLVRMGLKPPIFKPPKASQTSDQIWPGLILGRTKRCKEAARLVL